MALPRGIYFETSSLWPVAHRRDDPGLQELQRYSEILRIPLVATSLARDELAQKYKEECVRSQTALQSAVDDFTRRGLAAPSVTWPTPLSDVMDALPSTVQENLESYGLTILPNHEVNQERLLSMAVRKEPPFTEKGEKGFRDTVLLLTILAHARANNWRRIMLVTNDGPIIQACSSLPEAEGLEVQVARDVPTAFRMVDEFVDHLIRERGERRKVACRDVALQDREGIEEFMRQHGEFPETMFYDRLPPGEYPTGVLGMSLRELQVEALGELPRGTSEGDVRVTFKADVEVELKVSRSSWPPLRRFRIGAEAQDDLFSAAIRRRMVSRGETRKIPLQVRLEGSVHVQERDGREEFLDLQLDAFNPPGTFVAALFEALTQPGEEPPPPPPPPLEK